MSSSRVTDGRDRRPTVSIVTLGCPKNEVDSEVMAGILASEGFRISLDPDSADVVVVNTCAFIEEAERESIEVILEIARRSDVSLVVAGCLAQRRGRQVLEELPEVAAIIGPGRIREIATVVEGSLRGSGDRVRLGALNSPAAARPRLRMGTPAWAYVKISEGCSEGCTFCLIPQMRGRQRSRPIGEVLDEVRLLVAEGVAEIILVAQDTTAYGIDLYGRPALLDLLEGVRKEADGVWVRVLYANPRYWSDDLTRLLAEGPPLIPYLDLPVQHISPRVLQAMGRWDDVMAMRARLEYLRQAVPRLCLRTTVMVGHPGEGPDDFEELLAFLEDFPFDRLGVFPYSAERPRQWPQSLPVPSREESERRARLVLERQREVSKRLQRMLRGAKLAVLVEGLDSERGFLVGRSYREAPGIDGVVYVKASATDGAALPEIGEVLDCRVVGAGPYDTVAVPES